MSVETDAVWVETIRSSACGRCAARAGCGHGVLAGALQTGRGLIRARSGLSVSASECAVNDAVEIELPESAVTRASAIIYGAPLGCATTLALLVGGESDLGAAIGFSLGLLVGFGSVWLSGRWLGSRENNLEPQLVSRSAGPGDVIACGVS